MSRNQRIGLVVAAVLVAVLAFVIASPGGDDEGDKTAQTTPTTAEPSQAATESEDGVPVWLAVVALALGALGLLEGTAALVRSRA